MTPNSLRLFVDFDGTATIEDIGDSIFETFLDPELLAQGFHDNVITEWKAGRMSSFECLTLECSNTYVTRTELDRHLDGFDLTPGFVETVRYCADNKIPLMVLSDGLDYYIDYLLKKNDLGAVPFKSNHIFFDNGSLGVEFPHQEHGCGRCGNCKRWHMEANTADGETVVYVGDGYSDRYAIRNADVIFARGDLVEYCLKNDIKHRKYSTFHEILGYLSNGKQ
ncbi:haloacid dehalogenase-like hydrolase [Candidatus Latescibacterota bacterium]